MPSYKLIYFDLKGRGELSRLLFTISGVEFEDYRIKFPDWPQMKESFPFKQIPVLEVDGVQFAQSFAIASYLANEFGLYGKNNIERLKIDQILELIKDFIFYLNKSFKESDKDKKAEYMKEAVEVHSVTYLNYFEDMLKKSETGLFISSELTFADLAVYDHLDYVTERRPDALNDFPHLKALQERISANEKIKKYHDQQSS